MKKSLFALALICLISLVSNESRVFAQYPSGPGGASGLDYQRSWGGFTGADKCFSFVMPDKVLGISCAPAYNIRIDGKNLSFCLPYDEIVPAIQVRGYVEIPYGMEGRYGYPGRQGIIRIYP